MMGHAAIDRPSVVAVAGGPTSDAARRQGPLRAGHRALRRRRPVPRRARRARRAATSWPRPRRPTPWPWCPTATAWPRRRGDRHVAHLICPPSLNLVRPDARRSRPTWSTPSAAPCATCGSRSPIAATSAAPTACRKRACSGCRASEILTFEEIERLARVCVERFGVDGIRLTGGEPTVRAHLPAAGQQAGPLLDADLSMTTTGRRSASSPQDLPRPGLRPGQHLPRHASPRPVPRDHPARRARPGARRHRRRAGGRLRPGEDQRRARARRQRRRDRRLRRRSGREQGVEVRFIEFMPLDAVGRMGPRQGGVAGRDRRRHRRRVPARARAGRGAAPADRWRYLDGRGDVGVIPSVTKPFCGDCDRVRLTAEGQFRTCLFATASSTCGRSCAAGAATTTWPPRSSGPWARSGPATRSARSLHPAEPLDEPDRRLSCHQRPARLPLPHWLRSALHPPRSARPGPHGRRHAEGADAPAGRGPVQGDHAARDDGRHRQPRGQEGRRAGRGPGRRHPGREADLRHRSRCATRCSWARCT